MRVDARTALPTSTSRPTGPALAGSGNGAGSGKQADAAAASGTAAKEDGARTALETLKRIREDIPRALSQTSSVVKEAKARRRSVLQSELQRLIAQARSMASFLEPKAAAAAAARLAKQIAAVAKQLAGLADTGGGALSSAAVVAAMPQGTAAAAGAGSDGEAETGEGGDAEAEAKAAEAQAAQAEAAAADAERTAGEAAGEADTAGRDASTTADDAARDAAAETPGAPSGSTDRNGTDERRDDDGVRDTLKEAVKALRLLQAVVRRATVAHGTGTPREEEDFARMEAEIARQVRTVDTLAASLPVTTGVDIRV
ncbi:hypothetical protein [Rhodospirillum centenum]|uniref:Uncharacterized protein n=1 Tax=Rhodospirillum centenum (strain ATCC 51521 / SW) TaxID=414684 RepID=B6ISG7_RHOCS|nr:hypothetical protein [Rhodospirillum centenum]ACI98403.1 hypothetical protein RC1_0979 [Rhodospirillum centenum SW]